MGFVRKLSPTKQKAFKKRIFGFDCETFGNKNLFFMASIIGDGYRKIFYDKDELIREFFRNHIFRNSYIFATNLGFDFFCVFMDSEKIKDFNLLFRGSDILCASCRTDTSRNKITFLGTENYIKASVKTLGGIVGLRKLDSPKFIGKKPKNIKERSELERYNIRDSEISFLSMKKLYSDFISLGATPKLTIASTAMSLFRNRFLKDTYFTHKAEDLKNVFRCYYGGRTEAFKRGRIKNCNYYDINSLYPSVMTYSFPNPNTQRKSYGDIHKIMDFEGCSDVSLHCPFMDIPLLPLRKDDKLIFPTGNFSGWYTHIELRKALELGYEIKEVRQQYYYKENCFPFKEYVETLYPLRQEMQRKGDILEKTLKLFLNSLYGKFGQKFMDRSVFMHESQVTDKVLEKYDDFERIGCYFRLVRKEERPPLFCIPIWAAYVTAYGRIKIHEGLMKYDPIYCDTDSIITEKDMPFSEELGEFKLENRISEGIIIKPKMYQYTIGDETFRRLKGVPQRFIIDFNDIRPSQAFEVVKFMKFKESLRRRCSVNEIKDIKKIIDIEDTKRCWKKKFDFDLQESLPHNIES